MLASNFYQSHRRRRGGFTLVELLVTIGIIVVIVGLALPAVLRALKSGRRSRTLADFQLIGTALEAYKGDFGDYPRLDNVSYADLQSQEANFIPLDAVQDRGARLLCRALLGPAPATFPPTTGSAASATQYWNFDKTGGTLQAPDGANGPGFRTRPPALDANGNVVGGGKVYGPYVDGSKFQIGNPGAPGGVWDKTEFTDATLLDPQGNPILYYPATPGSDSQINVTTGGGYVATYNPGSATPNTLSSATPEVYPMYNAFDNAGYGVKGQPTFMPAQQLQLLLGDANFNGIIDGTEKATVTQPYLLWSAGEDGTFGTTPQLNGKTDDVTNFDLPPNLAKY